jgi:hypothetical protein
MFGSSHEADNRIPQTNSSHHLPNPQKSIKPAPLISLGDGDGKAAGPAQVSPGKIEGLNNFDEQISFQSGSDARLEG